MTIRGKQFSENCLKRPYFQIYFSVLNRSGSIAMLNAPVNNSQVVLTSHAGLKPASQYISCKSKSFRKLLILTIYPTIDRCIVINTEPRGTYTAPIHSGRNGEVYTQFCQVHWLPLSVHLLATNALVSEYHTALSPRWGGGGTISGNIHLQQESLGVPSKTHLSVFQIKRSHTQTIAVIARCKKVPRYISQNQYSCPEIWIGFRIFFSNMCSCTGMWCR